MPLFNKKDEEASLKELAGEGFPEKVSKAFQKAADEMNCVIWSRVPGKATTTAIDEGYNLKPFYIHGKSCDWGPMAGFACQLPALNKSGIGKMPYNLEEHLNSLNWLKKKQAEGVADWDKQHSDQTRIDRQVKYRNMHIADSLFLPLTISDARKQVLIDQKYLRAEGSDYNIIDENNIVGIAQDKDE